MLSAEYEKEQDELEQALASDQADLDQFNEDTDRADKFLALAKKYKMCIRDSNKVNFMERQGTCMEWTDMMHTQQQMQKIVRALLPVRKSLLTASECELLAHLYLYPEQNTPVLLSQESGKMCIRDRACSTQ